jgi:predicted transcriptional regulator
VKWRIYSLTAKKIAITWRRSMPVRSRALTRRESQIMEILHRRQRATIEEIRGELPEAPSPSSVRKLLDIMIERRLINREYDGPRFVYFPAAKQREAARSAVQQLLRTFFNDSPSSAMAALLDSGEISDEEYKRLSALLKQARGGRR